MFPTIHPKSTFRESFIVLAQVALDFFWKCWQLLRARPLLFLGVLLWGGTFLSWKIKALVVPGQIIWAIGLIMWMIGIRAPKR